LEPISFTGARLAPGERILRSMRVEDLARYRFFAERAAGTVLDHGCGAGEGAASLAAAGLRVIAVDEDGSALRYAAAAFAGPRFVRMDGERLALADECVDAVISVEVVEHVPNPAVYLAEARRVLRPGGLLVLTTPNQLRGSPTPGSLWPEHLREYRPAELERLLRASFESVQLWGQSIPLYEAHSLRRLVRRLAPFVKPILPRALRVRALPMVQTAIKAEISLDEVRFSRDDIEDAPTLVAVCRRS
jgi:SAM-dependent methyltransferase